MLLLFVYVYMLFRHQFQGSFPPMSLHLVSISYKVQCMNSLPKSLNRIKCNTMRTIIFNLEETGLTMF